MTDEQGRPDGDQGRKEDARGSPSGMPMEESLKASLHHSVLCSAEITSAVD